MMVDYSLLNEPTKLLKRLEAAEQRIKELMAERVDSFPLRKFTELEQRAESLQDKLDAALPKWTRITDDPETWPDKDEKIMTDEGETGAAYNTALWDRTWDTPKVVEGWRWRPLCDLDYPPETDDD